MNEASHLPELTQVVRRAIDAWRLAYDPADQDGEDMAEAIARAVIEAQSDETGTDGR